MGRLLRIAFVAWACGGYANADPWLPPGDVGLRHDIELLADAGILRGPVTTWPMSWPDIARDVQVAGSGAQLDSGTQSALLRVQRRAREAEARGFSGLGARISAAEDPTMLRTFSDSPRERAEAAIKASWLGNRIALNLQGAVVANPDDEKHFRPDGSYLGVNIGNFMISAGYMERWWGPGWEGSLILSTNARPIPSLTLERNYTDPFKTRLLSWIGPWRASIAVGEAESSGVAVPRVRFLAARVNFKPRPWLEVGLTRTAQWCGGDRLCDFGVFRDLLIGRDNRDESLSIDDEPGNQMAGYDLRLRSPWRKLPLALYTQWIGEDEAGGLPSKFLGQFGAEFWGSGRFGSYRLRAEFSDTACAFTQSDPEFECAYSNALYPQGYTYRGRIVGHAMDRDSQMTSFGAVLTRPNGDVASLIARRIEVNRNGGVHTLSFVPLTINNVELQYSRSFGFGQFLLGLGGDDRALDEDQAQIRGFVRWQQGF